MQDQVEPAGQAAQGRRVGGIAPDEPEAAPALQVGHVGAGAGGQVVEADDLGTGVEQPAAQVGSHESGSAGHQGPAPRASASGAGGPGTLGHGLLLTLTVTYVSV